MENGVLDGEIRTPSPIEEESFRQQIVKNRDKLRTDRSSDGFNSETDQDWETEGAESDAEREPKEDNKTEFSEKMRLSSESSSSSSSSSESSDSENEKVPHTEIPDPVSRSRKASSSSSSSSDNVETPHMKKESDKDSQSSDSEKEEVSQTEIPDLSFRNRKSSSSSNSDSEDTPHQEEEKDNDSSLGKKSSHDSENEEVSKPEMSDSTFRNRTYSSSSSSSSDSDNDDTSQHIKGQQDNDLPLDRKSSFNPVNEEIPQGEIPDLTNRSRKSSSSSSDSDNDDRPHIEEEKDYDSQLASESQIQEVAHSSSSESEDEAPQKAGDDNNSSASSYSENEEPIGKCGSYDVSSPELLDDSVHSASSDSSEDEVNDNEAVKEIPGSYRLRKGSQSSSSSNSDSESENKESKSDHENKEKHPSVRHIEKDPTATLPIVLDTSSSSSSESEDEQQNQSNSEKQVESPVVASESKVEFQSPAQDDTSHHQTNEPASTQNDALHGEELLVHEPNLVNSKHTSSSSSSSSSSDSETEDDVGPLVVRQKNDPERDSGDLTPQLLRKALEERERELQLKREKEKEAAALGARKPSEHSVVAEPTTPDYEHSYSPEAFDFNGDPSLRARTAFDFEETPPELPPKLPPKQRDITPIVAPNIGVHRETHVRSAPNERQQIFHVKDKTASLGRGMWSDEDDSGRLPSAHGNHPQADRVIDFSNNPDGDHLLKRSRSKSGRKKGSSRKRSKERKQSRSRSPSDSRSGHRVIDFRGKPYENPQDAINRQAMVSLHANNTYDTDPYDSVPETGDELNKLIEKANSLGYHNHYPAESEDVFPKTRVKEKKLDSKHQDAFAKIVAPLPLQAPPPAQKHYKSPVNSDHHSSDNSKRSSRSFSKKKRKNNPPVEAIDGDDEISLAESDINRFASPSPPPLPQKQEPSIPFVTEIYPSDYTEFETVSEAEFVDPMNTDRTESYLSEDTIQEVHYNPALQTGGESAYDTVADQTDTDFAPKANLNPIVSSNFQICSDISGSKSFPARLREGKTNKDRPGLEHIAIPLHQSKKKKNPYPTSLPYFGHDFTEDDDDFDRVPRRTGSVDDIPAIYPILNPSIVVHRQPTHPKGYRPELVQEVMVQSAPPLPEKKEKKKKEKKHKEIVEKPRPQIHLSVDGEGNENLNNNLQIQMLPSDDPNVINLNIRSTSVNPAGPKSLPVVTTQPIIHYPEPQPVTATVNTPYTSLPPQDNQHRVVEVSAPPMVVTGDELPPPLQYSTGGGVMLAGGVPTEILPNPILTAAAQTYPATTIQQQQSLPYPTVSLGAVQPVMHVPPPPLPMTQSLPPNAPIGPQPVINTTVSSAPIQQPPLQPNNEATVVSVESPWPLPEDKHSSLPSSLRDAKPDRIHRGDSGIDLTVHDRNRRHRSRTPNGRRRRRSGSRSSARHDTTSSSSDEGSRHRKRPISQKRLRSHDQLAPIAPSNEYMEWYKDKYMKPSCCYLFAKHLLFVINLIFTLAGLALVGLGIYGMVKLHQSEITDPAIIFLDPLFIVMVLGFVIALVAFHGAAGFVRDNICMLKCFGSFMVILFILFAAGGIVFWAMLGNVKNITISTYNDNIIKYNPEKRIALSYSLDLMQSTFECCGIDAPSQWNKNKLFECETSGTCRLPKSCCRSTQDQNLECQSSSDLSYKTTCIDAMSLSVKNNTPLIVGIWLAIWALMMIELLCVYFMCKEITYLQKMRDFVADPVKHMETRQSIRNDSENESGEPSEESETSSSEEEYRRRRHRRRKREEKKHKKKGKREKKKKLGSRTASERGRRGSYHVNRTFSVQDERSSYGRRSRRGSSRSRSGRGSY